MGCSYMHILMGWDVKAEEERRWVTEYERYNRQIKIDKTSGIDTMRINGRQQWDPLRHNGSYWVADRPCPSPLFPTSDSYPSTLKKEAAGYYEASVLIYQTSRRHVLEYYNHNTYKSCMKNLLQETFTLVGCRAAYVVGCCAAYVVGCCAAYVVRCCRAYVLGCCRAYVVGYCAAYVVGCCAAYGHLSAMFFDSIPVPPSRIRTSNNKASNRRFGANTGNSVIGDWTTRDITGVGPIKEQYQNVQCEPGE
jgi:hypothetical protein